MASFQNAAEISTWWSSSIAQTLIGIGVSLVLFFFGYRQTVGARKERARNALAAILRALIRRLILEEYDPAPGDIARLRDGKAAAFQLRPTDLPDEEAIVTRAFTEVFDSDLVPSTVRVSVEERLRRYLAAMASSGGADDLDEPRGRGLSSSSTRTLGAMGLATAVIGTLVSVVPTLGGIGVGDLAQALPVALTVLVGSVSIMTYLISVRRGREAVVERAMGAAMPGVKLEMDTAKLLDRLGIAYDTGVRVGFAEIDILATVAGRRIPIEVKAWREVPTLAGVSRALSQLRYMKTQTGAPKAVLVVPTVAELPARLVSDADVAVVTLKQLPDVLSEIRTSIEGAA